MIDTADYRLKFVARLQVWWKDALEGAGILTVEDSMEHETPSGTPSPSPWMVADGTATMAVVIGPGVRICEVDGGDKATNDANARLIAAAPRLLSALRGMIDAWHDYVSCDKQICLRFVPDGTPTTPHRTCVNTGSELCELCAARAAIGAVENALS